jgi:hypothetical protein
MYGTLLKPDPVAKLDKLRIAAQHFDCVLCGKDKRFTVAAHSNALAHGRGSHFKAPGYLIAYVCGDPGGCHDQIDGRAGGLSLEEKRAMWNRAYVLTVALWFTEGLVRIA